MDAFGYLSVLISIILGWGITELLTKLGRLIVARDRVRFYWPPVAWALLLLVVHVQTWWTLFGLREHERWNFFVFLLVLLQPIVLYLVAALVLPDFAGEGPVDLRAHYFGNVGWLFGLLMAIIVVSIGRDAVIDHRLPHPFNLVVQLLFFAGAAIAAVVRREWYHKLLVTANIALIGVYIAVLFAQLR